jgi:restriction system protein
LRIRSSLAKVVKFVEEMCVAVPDYQTLMLPLLRCLSSQSIPVTVRQFLEPIADEFNLTEEDRAARIPSGQENLLANRLQWARTYMGKAGLLASPKRGVVQVTDRGRTLLAEGLDRIDVSTLGRYPEFIAWVVGSRGAKRNDSLPAVALTGASTSSPPALQTIADDRTPRERIDTAMGEIEAALRSELLDHIRRMSPAEFEGLILKLLLAMGYGQGLDEMASALGGSGDGGMDGVIHQDPLGLERVYVQAKRYKEGNNVSSPDIRNFIGALNIHRANKGVFVTASQFTADARQAAQGSTVQVVLIDGDRLSDLMVRYKVGVLVRGVIEIKELDEGFFDV